MNSTLLDKNKHDRKRFNCGIEVLNNYLCLMANQQSGKDNSRTFVLEDQNNSQHIIGFYTLVIAPIDLKALPDKLQKKHQNSYTAGLIARFAVDKRYTKQGYGEWLLVDVLHKLLSASDSVAFPIIIVDAKAGAVKFYENFGFKSFIDTPNKLFITIATVQVNLSNH